MSTEYANMTFDTTTDAKRASISMFLQAESPAEAPGLDFDNADMVDALAREMSETGWMIPGEGAVCVDRARTLILDWSQGA